MKTRQVIEVHFSHPRDITKILAADVSPECTGQEALQELLADNGESTFLVPIPPSMVYELVVRRNQQAITPNMSFEQAGVIDGDWIEVRIAGIGGGTGWSELGYMLFWSAAAASMFLKSAAPILIEFIKSRGTRSIIVERGDVKVSITGAAPEKVKEILKLLENMQADENLLRGAGQRDDSSNLPIKVTLRDFAKPDSTEQ